MSPNHKYYLFEDRIKKELIVYKLEMTSERVTAKARSKTIATPVIKPLEFKWGAVASAAKEMKAEYKFKQVMKLNLMSSFIF